jgi:hypothetical protein
MKALTKILAGGVVAAALFGAAPAAAQYYPGYGGYGGGDVISQVLGQVLGGGMGYGQGYSPYGYNGYGQGMNSQAAVGQCVNAVQARLSRGSGGYGYSQYGYNGYGQGRVVGISRVEPRRGGGLTIRGVANSGAAGYAYGGQQQIDLTFRCRTDYRGFITSVSVDRAQVNYGYNQQQYTPYNQQYAPQNPYNPYEAYGYRRY